MPDEHRRTLSLATHSIRLLTSRIPDFNVVEWVDRWRRYEVGEKLGQGAMGVVLRAFDRELKREVALKCVTGDELDNTDNTDRFFDEIQLHARLTHPSIAPIHDFGLTPDGHLFMAMELVFGETLEAVIKRYHQSGEHPTAKIGSGSNQRPDSQSSRRPNTSRRLRAVSADDTGEFAETSPSSSSQPLAPVGLHENVSLIELLDRFARVCEAVAFAHSSGIVHRDIKPENVICGDFGEVRVMDWGLATTYSAAAADQLLEATAAERAAAHTEVRKKISLRLKKARARARHGEMPVTMVHQSMAGSVVGTIGYMSPEQALGRTDRIDHRSDVYALGCILYEVLCGKPPVHDTSGGKEIWRVLDNVIDGRILPPTQRAGRHHIPDELSAIALRGIAREPKDRYQSVAELRGAVMDWIGRQAMTGYVVIEIEETLLEAQNRLKAGRPLEARLLLNSALQKLETVDVPDRLRAAVRSLHDQALQDIAERDERSKTTKLFRDLRSAVIESQFGLVLANLRLPAPTIRRAHDRIFSALQESGVWFDPVDALSRFEKVRVNASGESASDETRAELVSALFLMAWVALRLATVTSVAAGRDKHQRNGEQALRLLEKLADDYRAAKMLAARLATMREDEAEAKRLEALADETPARGPDDHLYLATIAFGDYHLEQALEHVHAALDIDPGAFWGHALLIFIHNGMGDRHSTYAALRTCQALQPRQPILWVIRGFLQREYGEFEAAHASLDRSLRYGPSDPLARLIRADLRLRLGRIDWQRDLDMAADLVTPPVTTWDYFVLALIALYKGDVEYALEFVRAAQMRSPGMPQLYGLEASILMRSGIYDLAEDLLRKALDMAPNDPRLSESLLALLVAQKRYGEARSKYLDDEERRPGGATPSVLLLAARAFAGYSGGEKDEDDQSDVQQALMLLHKAARSGVIATEEVEEASEFASLRDKADYRRIKHLLRPGLPAPRLFQPAINDVSAELA